MVGDVSQCSPKGRSPGALDVVEDRRLPATAQPDQTQRVVFLGGLLLENQIARIERVSRTAVQHAADVLQRTLLERPTLHADLDMRIVNVPYIGSYPKTCRGFGLTHNSLRLQIGMLLAGLFPGWCDLGVADG